MAHSHNHDHTYTSNSNYKKAFTIGIILNIAFVIIEIVFGFTANSSALLADAGHNAGDVLSLVFSWTAIWLATLKPRGKYTYGLRKTTILVSILNTLLLFAAMAFIGKEAVEKFRNPQPVIGDQVMIVAGIGVIINTITSVLFIKGQKDDLNIKSAFLHMAADAGVSLGVVISGLLIKISNLYWIDPVTSMIIIVIVLLSSWRLFSDSINLALDAVPRNIDVEKVRNYLLSKEGVDDIHDLHIWAISTSQISLTAHLFMPQGNDDNFIAELQEELKHEFGIGHITLQIENKITELECSTDC